MKTTPHARGFSALRSQTRSFIRQIVLRILVRRIPSYTRLLVVLLAFTVAPPTTSRNTEHPGTRAGTESPSPRVAMPFVENRGRASDDVRFVVDGAGRSLFFTPRGVTIAMRANGASTTRAHAWAVRLGWIGDRSVEPVAEAVTESSFRYHGSIRIGAADDAAAARGAYRLRYPEVWPGIDLVFLSEPGEVKYQFELAAGADPNAVRMVWEGAESVDIGNDGAMLVSTPVGTLRDVAPVAWQPATATDTACDVDASWRLDASRARHHEFGVDVGEYDTTRALVIDPALFVSCGYLGGAAENFAGPASEADEAITDVAIDPDGRMILCGWTTSTSTSFPVRVGPIIEAAGDRDAFVARLDPTGTEIEFCSFLGGENRDEAYGVAIDDTGSTYIVGYTLSDETTFPVRIGPSVVYHGAGDGFIARIGHDQRLDHCGYLGTSAVDWVASIAVDPESLDTIVVGATRTGELPTREGPDTTYNGSLDGFVGRLEFGGADFRWLGYLGGIYDDVVTDVAIDALGRARVVGSTWSDESTFPVAVGPDLTYNHPVPGFTRDAFVATVAVDGRMLEACGYIGGLAWDTANAIAIDAEGAAIVVGDTLSDETSFPVLEGPVTTFSGATGILGDAFVARVTSDGTALTYCGYLGSSFGDAAYGVAIDRMTGDAWVTGVTYGDDFPALPGGIGEIPRGNGDAFLARVSSLGELMASGYLGGAGEDIGEAVAFDELAGSVVVVGSTGSTAGQLPITAGPSVRHAGGHPTQSAPTDGFVARVIAREGPAVTVSIDEAPMEVRAGETLRLSVTVTNHTSESRMVTGWVEGLKPDRAASVRNPILGPRTARVRPGSVTRTIELRIPEGTPAQGPIELRVLVGPEVGRASHLAAVQFSITD